jgi:MFS family permease
MNNDQKQKMGLKSLVMWSFPLIFFAFQFIPRLWLGQIADHSMAQLSIGLQEFGYISALYYFGYAGMQIPVAMMLDRFPPRYVISGLIFLLSMAFLTFTLTNNWIVASGARFFIGVGSAGGFLGVSKILSQWFDRKTYAKMLGISIAVGIFGAVYGGAPTYIMVQKFGVNAVAFGIVGIGIFLCLAVMAFVRSPEHGGENSEILTLSHLKELIGSPVIWILGAVNLLLVGALEGFADVWGERYLVDCFGFDKRDALSLASMIFVGLISGSPFVPVLGKKFGDYGVINICGLGILSCFVLVFFHVLTSFQALAFCFFMMGVFSAYQTNLIAAGTDLVRPVLMGVTVAFLNSWNMFGGTFFHSIIGSLISHGDLKPSEHVYVVALSCIPIAAVIGIILMFGLNVYLKNRRKSKV